VHGHIFGKMPFYVLTCQSHLFLCHDGWLLTLKVVQRTVSAPEMTSTWSVGYVYNNMPDVLPSDDVTQKQSIRLQSSSTLVTSIHLTGVTCLASVLTTRLLTLSLTGVTQLLTSLTPCARLIGALANSLAIGGITWNVTSLARVKLTLSLTRCTCLTCRARLARLLTGSLTRLFTCALAR